MSRFGAIDVLVNNAGTNPYFGPLMDIDPVRAEKTVRPQPVRPGPVEPAGLEGVDVRPAAARSSTSPPSAACSPSPASATTTPPRPRSSTSPASSPPNSRPAVRVNGVAPGIVRTQLARGLWENNEQYLNDNCPSAASASPTTSPTSITFLGGPASRWMTGQTLVVDGGAQIRSSLA